MMMTSSPMKALLDNVQADGTLPLCAARHLLLLITDHAVTGTFSDIEIEHVLTGLTVIQNALIYNESNDTEDLIFFADRLRNIIECEDLHVVYLATKCLAWTLLSCKPTSDYFLQAILSRNEESPTFPIFHILILILSQKKIWNSLQSLRRNDIFIIQKCCIDSLAMKWDIIFDLFIKSLNHVQYNYCWTLTSLWRKVLKWIMRHSAFTDAYITFFTHSLELVNIVKSYPLRDCLLYINMLKVVDLVLVGSSQPSLITSTCSISSFRDVLSQHFLNAIETNFLQHVPVCAGRRHNFTGEISIQDNYCHGYDGKGEPIEKWKRASFGVLDLVCHRVLLTVFLRTCDICVNFTVKLPLTMDTKIYRHDKVLPGHADVQDTVVDPVIDLESVAWRLNTISRWSSNASPRVSSGLCHWAVVALSDQDTHLVQAMLHLLHIYTSLRYCNDSATFESVAAILDPHLVFLSFLSRVCYDHTLLLDLITSPETVFLDYVINYLQYIANEWPELCAFCKNWPDTNNEARSKDFVKIPPQNKIPQNRDDLDIATDALRVPSECIKGYCAGAFAEDSTCDDVSCAIAEGAVPLIQERPPGHEAKVSATEHFGAIQAALVEEAASTLASVERDLLHVTHTTSDLAAFLATLLQRVGGEKLRAVEKQVSRDVDDRLCEMRRKQVHMSRLLREACLSLGDDMCRTSEDASQLPLSGSPCVRTAELRSPSARHDLHLGRQTLVSTAYADSESEEEDDHTLPDMPLLASCTRYLSSASDCETLRRVIAELERGQSTESLLVDYATSDEEEEQRHKYVHVLPGISDKTGSTSGCVHVPEQLISYSDSDSESDDDVMTGTSLHLSELTLIPYSDSESESSSDVDIVEDVAKLPRWIGSPALDDMMSVLIRLRFSIERMVEKSIFPYNCTPLLKIMAAIEKLYET